MRLIEFTDDLTNITEVVGCAAPRDGAAIVIDRRSSPAVTTTDSLAALIAEIDVVNAAADQRVGH